MIKGMCADCHRKFRAMLTLLLAERDGVMVAYEMHESCATRVVPFMEFMAEHS